MKAGGRGSHGAVRIRINGLVTLCIVGAGVSVHVRRQWDFTGPFEDLRKGEVAVPGERNDPIGSVSGDFFRSKGGAIFKY